MDRAILISAMMGLLARGAFFLVHIFAGGLILRRFGMEALGVWSVIANLSFFVGIFDFAIGGSGMRNHLATLRARQVNTGEDKEIFTSVFQFSIMTNTLLFTLALIILPFMEWGDHFSIQDPTLRNQLSLLLFFSLLTLFIRAPFALNEACYQAYGEGVIRSLLYLLEAISFWVVVLCGFKFFFLVIMTQLLWLFWSYFSFRYFLKRRSWTLRRVPLSQMWRVIRSFLVVSLLFWVMNLFHLLLTSQQPLVIATLISAEVAGEYSLFHRLFSMMIGIHFTLLSPLWSGYTRAHTQGRTEWITRHLKSSLIATCVIFGVGTLLLLICHEEMFAYWTGQRIRNIPLTLATATWAFALAWGNSCGTFLNGVGRVKGQVVAFALGGLIHWFLAPLLAKHWQAIGVMISSSIALIPYIYWTTRCAFSLLNLERSAMSS